MTDRFDGWISGLGTTSGRRVVVGHWLHSPSHVRITTSVGG